MISEGKFNQGDFFLTFLQYLHNKCQNLYVSKVQNKNAHSNKSGT